MIGDVGRFRGEVPKVRHGVTKLRERFFKTRSAIRVRSHDAALAILAAIDWRADEGDGVWGSMIWLLMLLRPWVAGLAPSWNTAHCSKVGAI